MSRTVVAINPLVLVAGLMSILSLVEAKEMVVSRAVGVIQTPDIAKAAANAEVGRQFPPGTRVTRIREVNDPNAPGFVWALVETNDGRTGWVQASALIDVADVQRSTERRTGENRGETAQSYFINNEGSAARLVANPSFQNTGGDVALLPLGTAVTGLETRPDPALPFLEWHRVKVTEGPHNGKIGWVSVGVLESTQSRPVAATHIIDNDGSAARVVSVPSYRAAADFANDVGTVARGTPVKVTETRADAALPILRWSRVEILAGPHKGKSGWVSGNALRTDRTVEVRFRSFIPSPMVGYGGESVLNSFLGNLVFGGDNRGFGYGKPGYRSHQSAIVTLTPDRIPLIDQSRDWGPTRVYLARQAAHVQGRPIWWLAPKGEQAAIITEKRSVTNANNSISSRRITGNAVLVHLKLSGANPGEPMSAILGKIDADVNVYLRENDKGDLEYRFDVQHDGFPAYELYIDGQDVYTHDPVAEKQHPLSLMGTGSGEFSKSTDWAVLAE